MLNAYMTDYYTPIRVKLKWLTTASVAEDIEQLEYYGK